MTIKIYNDNKLTRSAFFGDLLDFLDRRVAEILKPTLREIHQQFSPKFDAIDREMEKFIDAGLVIRKNKRYCLGQNIFDDSSFDLQHLTRAAAQANVYHQPFFVREGQLSELLDRSIIYQSLNGIFERSDYARTEPTLANYFYKVAENLELTAPEKEIYSIMGDVNPTYATSFIKAQLIERPRKADIFSQVIEKYQLTVDNLADPELPMVNFQTAADFIAAQICQQNS